MADTTPGTPKAPFTPEVQAAIKGQTLLEFNLEMQKTKAVRENIEATLQQLKIGKQSAIEAKNAYDLNKKEISLKREYINVMRDAGASQKELTAITKALEMPTKMTTDEFRNVWDSFKSGKMKLSEFAGTMKGNFGAALGSLSKGLTPATIGIMAFTTAIKVFNEMQNRSKSLVTGFSAAGGGLTSSLRVMPTGVDAEYTRNIAKIYEKSSDQINSMINAWMQSGLMSKRVTKGKEQEFYNESAGIGVLTQLGLEKLAPTMKNTDVMMNMFVRRLGVDSKDLLGAFSITRDKILNLTDLPKNASADQLVDIYISLANEMTKFGGTTKGAGGLLEKFGEDITNRSMDLSALTNALSQQGTQSVSKDMQTAALLKRFNITASGLNLTGDAMADAQIWKAFAEKNKAQALQLQIRLATKLAGQNANGPALITMMRMLEEKGIGTGIDLNKLSTKQINKIISLGQAGQLTDELLNKTMGGSRDKTVEELTNLDIAAYKNANIGDMWNIGGNALLDPAKFNKATSGYVAAQVGSLAGDIANTGNIISGQGIDLSYGGSIATIANLLWALINEIKSSFSNPQIQIITTVPGLKAEVKTRKTK